MIRKAKMTDIGQMVALGKEMHQESLYRKYEFDELKVVIMLGNMIKDPNAIVLVSEVAGAIEGGMVGFVTPAYFGPETQAFDMALFVSKDKRHGTTGLKLIKAFAEAAEQLGASQVVLGNSTGICKEGVMSLYERAGFHHVGYVMSKDLKG